MVQLRHPLYSPDLRPCDFFPVYFTKKQPPHTEILASKCSWQCHCSVPIGCIQKVYLSAFSLDFKTRNWVSVDGEYQPLEMNKIWISPIIRLAEPQCHNKMNVPRMPYILSNKASRD